MVWFKRILVCSAIMYTGGCYVTHWQEKMTINCFKKHDQKSTEDISSYIYLPEDGEIDLDESAGIFWKKISLPTYWKLLMLCKSKDFKVRHKAVESLSKLNLEKWQYAVVAQACDVNTAIGLARSPNANPHFFLPPPFKDLDKGNLQNELYLMLSALPFSDLDACIQNLLKQVIKSANALLKNGYNLDLEVGDPFVIFHSQQKKKAVFFYDKLCLETILACSSKSCHRSIMIKKQILKLLLKVLESHKSDIEIQSLISRILANLAVDENFRNTIYMTGWIGILSEWKKSPYITINLPATKALANLDNDDLSHPLYDDGIYLLNPVCRISSQKDLSADVIFIHGLLGATFWTWRQCDKQVKSAVETVVEDRVISTTASSKQYSMCWPKDWLSTHIPSLRIISIDYKTHVSNWRSYCPQENEKNYINKRAREIMNKLLLSNVGERPIIWITHSMGGLIAKQILVESFKSKDDKMQSFVKNTVGIIFYSVPHKGSELVNKIKSASIILQPSNSIEELQKGSATLISLHDKFKDIISKYEIPVLSFGETKKSRWGLTLSVLVPLDSANPGFGEFYTLPVDHLSTCKPVSMKSPEYLKVLNFLKVNLSNINAKKKHSLQISNKIFEICKVLSLIP